MVSFARRGRVHRQRPWRASARAALVLAGLLILVQGSYAQSSAVAGSKATRMAGDASVVSDLPLPPARKATPVPASSILVVVRRAYVLGSGSGRFCSPEISVFNQANKGVAILMVAAEYFQPQDGSMKRVGSSHTRFTIDPGETVSVGFNRLSTGSCDNVVARASVSACLWRDRSGCDDRVVFSDSGQIPMLTASGGER